MICTVMRFHRSFLIFVPHASERHTRSLISFTQFQNNETSRTHMQNPDGFWEAWGAENHVTRVTYRPGGRSYHLFTFLRKKMAAVIRSAADFNAIRIPAKERRLT